MRRALMLFGCLLVLAVVAAPASGAVVAAVGDMACSPNDSGYKTGYGTATTCRQKYVSDLVVKTIKPDAFLSLGDNQYNCGELANYQAVYAPTFGRLNPEAFPAIGNAEYGLPTWACPTTSNGQGFFQYFGAAGNPFGAGGSLSKTSAADLSNAATGYYSYNIGTWHLVALNSMCEETGVCSAAAQEAWLASDLARHADRCTIAYWHHPRWNTGTLGNDTNLSHVWSELYNGGVDIVLNGHANHHYERFAPQTPTGVPNSVEGVREFIVSTGGQNHGTAFKAGDAATSLVRDYTSFGALKLTLNAGSYTWQFVPEPSTQVAPGVPPALPNGFADSGSGACHSATAKAPGVPASFTATAGNGSVHLAWSAPAGTPPTSDGGAPITAYRVYRGTTAGAETVLATTAAATPTAFDDTTAANGTTYYYRVAAVNYVGAGAQAPERTALPLFPGSVHNTTPPSINGTARVGVALTANAGVWTGTTPITFTDQWSRCTATGLSCTPIAAATKVAYTPASADVGATIRVTVTAANAVAYSRSLTTPQTVVVPAAAAATTPHKRQVRHAA